MFIVKVPGVNNSKNIMDCKNTGNIIINSLSDIKINESGRIVDKNLLDLEEIHLDNSNLELTFNLIYENSLEIFSKKPKTIFIGGDHSITYPICSAFLKNCFDEKKEPCLIVFDAHMDCFESDKKFPNNKEWLRKLIEKGFFPKNIFLVGTRNFGLSENSFAKEKGINIMGMNQIRENIQDSCDILMEFSRGKELYVSIDIDSIDPAFAPGTNNLEPGGISSRDFLYFIQRINLLKNLRGVDIVEINPEKDINNSTIKLGAKIVSEIF